jgi:hypothetical protein
MKFEIFKAIVFIYLGYVTGLYAGFKDGVESIEFDRITAQQKIRQCLRVVGGVR